MYSSVTLQGLQKKKKLFQKSNILLFRLSTQTSYWTIYTLFSSLNFFFCHKYMYVAPYFLSNLQVPEPKPRGVMNFFLENLNFFIPRFPWFQGFPKNNILDLIDFNDFFTSATSRAVTVNFFWVHDVLKKHWVFYTYYCFYECYNDTITIIS